MKNLKFISGLALGTLLGTILLSLVKCNTDNGTPTTKVPDSFVRIQSLEEYHRKGAPAAFKLILDNSEYVVVSGGSDGGIAIIKHR